MENSTVTGKYKEKRFSFLGDSISTLEGHIPDGYKVFYNAENCSRAQINGKEDTWWYKVAEHFGGEVLVNNSWSGSWVAKLPSQEELFPSGCSDERTSALHKGNTMPDVIVVCLGTNDWFFGASTDYKGDLEYLKYQTFGYAYKEMLGKLKNNYPDAEIWCCTLACSRTDSNPGFIFKDEYFNQHISVFCDIIRQTAETESCKLIDLYRDGFSYDSIDGAHPTAKGMQEIADAVIKEISRI